MDSILAQTLTDWELIVCDSFSDDGTWEFLQRFKDDPRVRLYQVPKDGLYAGWNECLRRCRGEYVYIATADDTMVPECLERMVSALQAAQTADNSDSPHGSQRTHRPTNEEPDSQGRKSSRLPAGYGIYEREEDEELPTSYRVGTLQAEEQSTKHQEPYSQSFQSAVCGLQSGAQHRPVDLCVCRYDRIDSEGNVLPHESEDLKRFYGDRLEFPHVRSGWLEFLVVTGVSCHWNTVTAMLFRRSLLDKVGLFRTDCGNAADRVWRWTSLLYSDVVYLPDRLATWREHDTQSTAGIVGRHPRWLYDRLADLLDAREDVFPETWRKDPAWKARVLHHFRKEYYKSFRLNKNALKNQPSAFAKGVLRAARHDPRYLLHRLRSGFGWNDSWLEDEVAFVRRLVDEWNV